MDEMDIMQRAAAELLKRVPRERHGDLAMVLARLADALPVFFDLADISNTTVTLEAGPKRSRLTISAQELGEAREMQITQGFAPPRSALALIREHAPGGHCMTDAQVYEWLRAHLEGR